MRPAGDLSSPSITVDPLSLSEVVKSLHFENDDIKLSSVHLEDKNAPHTVDECASPDISSPSSRKNFPVTETNDLVGSNFLLPKEDGQR